MSSISSQDNPLFGMGGLGAETMRHVDVDIDFLSFLVGEGGAFLHTPRGAYANSIVLSDTGPEGTRRKCFTHSVITASESGSEFTAVSRQYGDHVRAGPTDPSVFSRERDGMTVASRTSASGAVAFRDPAAGDWEEQGPAIIALENSASPDIGNLSHPYHTSAEPTETGSGASSATAMASLASQAAAAAVASSTPWSRSKGENKFDHRRRPDPTAEAARLPCELAPLTGCTVTIPLHFSGAGLDAWIAHHVGDDEGPRRGHLGQTFPRATGCWFCDETFAMDAVSYETPGVAEAVYRVRMKHITAHFLRLSRDRDGPDQDSILSCRPPDQGLIAHLKEVGRWDDEMEAALRRLSRHDEDDKDDDEDGENTSRDEKGKQKATPESTPELNYGATTTTTTPPPSMTKMRSAMDKAPPLTINRQRPPAGDPMIIITERRRGTGRRGGPVVIQQKRMDR